MAEEGATCHVCWQGRMQVQEGMLVCDVCGSVDQVSRRRRNLLEVATQSSAWGLERGVGSSKGPMQRRGDGANPRAACHGPSLPGCRVSLRSRRSLMPRSRIAHAPGTREEGGEGPTTAVTVPASRPTGPGPPSAAGTPTPHVLGCRPTGPTPSHAPVRPARSMGGKERAPKTLKEREGPEVKAGVRAYTTALQSLVQAGCGGTGRAQRAPVRHGFVPTGLAGWASSHAVLPLSTMCRRRPEPCPWCSGSIPAWAPSSGRCGSNSCRSLSCSAPITRSEEGFGVEAGGEGCAARGRRPRMRGWAASAGRGRGARRRLPCPLMTVHTSASALSTLSSGACQVSRKAGKGAHGGQCRGNRFEAVRGPGPLPRFPKRLGAHRTAVRLAGAVRAGMLAGPSRGESAGRRGRGSFWPASLLLPRARLPGAHGPAPLPLHLAFHGALGYGGVAREGEGGEDLIRKGRDSIGGGGAEVAVHGAGPETEGLASGRRAQARPRPPGSWNPPRSWVGSSGSRCRPSTRGCGCSAGRPSLGCPGPGWRPRRCACCAPICRQAAPCCDWLRGQILIPGPWSWRSSWSPCA